MKIPMLISRLKEYKYMTNNIFIALGTNIGNRRDNLNNALSALEEKQIFQIDQSSHIYETEPWGYLDQDSFLNMVIQGSSIHPPTILLKKLKSLEIQLGRSPTFHYGPRVIDMDILFYDQQIVKTPKLIIPHPEMQNRDFVLFPLCEIAPDLEHPLFQKSTSAMLKALPQSNIFLADYPEIESSLLRNLILNPPSLSNYLQAINSKKGES
jgi:2-amino-4-hydroxy-6-hydroxymethyldihydropteridine diphosphokinase